MIEDYRDIAITARLARESMGPSMDSGNYPAAAGMGYKTLEKIEQAASRLADEEENQ